MPPDRLTQLLAKIDALNSEDPTTEIVDGAARPRELVYAERLSAWVLRWHPEASEALRIAARGQHVRRWTIPRDRYERTRRGYLRWRETLKAFHVQEVARLMEEVGYPGAMIERVKVLMSKRALGTDAETQTLEDALCLVFLETQYADLRRRTPEPAMRQVLRKTWAKMSEPARAAARALPLGEADRRALEQALLESP